MLSSSDFCDSCYQFNLWQIVSDGETHLKGRKHVKKCFLKHYSEKTLKLIMETLIHDVYDIGGSKLANYRFKLL